ncbi:MAG: Fic family protein [Campylobacterales bacterium]|nr:Fic family protein [Campylobacterales bacterium]
MKPVGYAKLLEMYGLHLPKMEVEYFQGDHHTGIQTVNYGASKRKILPSRIKIKDTPFDHIKAAIKYQGIRLQYLYVIFSALDPKDLEQPIKDHPMSNPARVIWYLYEWLMKTKLDVPNLTTGNYIKLFDSKYYFTRLTGKKCRRTRVINNGLGNLSFCPIVRKTKEIKKLSEIDVYETAYGKMQEMGIALNANIVDRCINYLYTKESKTSSEIEREVPNKQRLLRFNQALKNAGMFNLTKQTLINIQNQIVDDKAKIGDYRREEIYVGETKIRGSFHDEEVHFVGPKAKHVKGMMSGLLEAHEHLMTDCDMPPLMHATVISFGLVYIHPFDDGNGRTHRYLLHDVFKQRDKRHEFIIPISATILKNEKEYDKVLNTVSHPLMLLLNYELDAENDHRIIIHNDLHYMYRYPDFTPHIEYIYAMMDTSIKLELLNEVVFLTVFDGIKKIINDSADIPENHLNNIVNIIINNGGRVSNSKREYALKYLNEEGLLHIEERSVELIENINILVGVDIKALKLE